MNKILHLVFIFCCLQPGLLPAQVAISTDKMNVLFPGPVNPLTVVVNDLPDSNLLLIPSMGEIKRISEGHYGWTIFHQCTDLVTLTIRDIHGDSVVHTQLFRVKNLPIPVPYLSNRSKSGAISKGEYCGGGGIAVVLENFDFDFKCDVLHFNVQYIPKGKFDTLIKKNIGARWTGEVQDLINKATPGDFYYFYHIAYRCGCDPMVRYLSETLIFKIK